MYFLSGDKRMDFRVRFMNLLAKLFILFVMVGFMMSEYFMAGVVDGLVISSILSILFSRRNS